MSTVNYQNAYKQATMNIIGRLMKYTIVKQSYLAQEKETAESKEAWNKYFKAITKQDTVDDYDYTYVEIIAADPTVSELNMVRYMAGTIEISEFVSPAGQTKLLYDKRTHTVTYYEELNDYYRALLGLPNLGTPPEDYIYIDGVPYHELTYNQILQMQQSGELGILINNYNTYEYMYVFYKQFNLNNVFMRQAAHFDILYYEGTTEASLYRECFIKEMAEFKQTFHAPFLSEKATYNEALELINVKSRAVISYILETGVNLNKKVYTVDEAKFIWKEFNLSMPEEMPQLYRDATTFILDYLILNKGTNRVVDFIARGLFSNLRLYKYYICKKHIEGADTSLPITDQYDVRFILQPFHATNHVDEFDSDEYNSHNLTYDEVVQMDPRWSSTQELKEAVFREDFAYYESKYLSIGNIIDLNKLSVDYPIVARIYTENRADLERVKIMDARYAGCDLFQLFVYYNAWMYFITYPVMSNLMRNPDTFTKMSKLYGFKLPELQDWIRLRDWWKLYFANTGYENILNDLNPVEGGDNFYDFVTKINYYLIAEPEIMDAAFDSEEGSWQFDFAQNIYRMLRIVNHSPTSYNIVPDAEGMSDYELLESVSPKLKDLFDSLIAKDSIAAIATEFEYVTTLMISVLKPLENSVNGYPDLVEASFTLNSLHLTGVSQYFVYILKIFKSYCTDLLTSQTRWYLKDKEKTMDDFGTDGAYFMLDPHGMSQHDAIILDHFDNLHIKEPESETDSIFYKHTKISQEE